MAKLDANESPFNLGQAYREEIGEKVKNLSFNIYPDEDSDRIKELFGDYLGARPEEITIGNGSDELLGNIISFLLKEGDKLFLFEVDFGMYTYYAGKRGVEPVYYQLRPGEDFEVGDFIQAVRESGANMLMFSNPNNPTGRAIKREELEEIIQSIDHIPVILDEAYGEFSDKSLLDSFREYDNLYITRTLSKALGLAAIRVGACVSREENIKFLEENKAPYNVSSLGQLTAETVLSGDYEEDVEKNVAYIVGERERIFQALEAMDSDSFTYFPSEANFVYMESDKQEEIVEKFINQGIAVRDFGDSKSFRISIGRKEDNDKVLTILEEV